MLKAVLIVLLVAGYAVGSHFSLLLPEGKVIAAALAVGIPAIALGCFISQWSFTWLAGRETGDKPSWVRWLAAIGLALIVILVPLVLVWPLILANTDTLYFAQHLGTNALLAWVFGHTLLVGSTPLVVTFARKVHPDLPVEIETYARHVTLAWTLFFVVTCLVSFFLFIAAPLSAWSTFAILLQWPSVGIFFVGEYALRRYLFKGFNHATLKQGFDAYRLSQAGSPAHAGTKPTADLGH